MATVKCQNCEWEGDEGECDDIKDFFERVAPGEICPVGECPECGCVTHYVEIPSHTVEYVVEYLARKEAEHATLEGTTVELANRGNPDHGQNPDEPVWGGPEDRHVPVETFQEASNLCRQYITEHDLGMGNWTGGMIKIDGKTVAYVTYGGRVFHQSDDEPSIELKEEITDLNQRIVDAVRMG